MSSKLCVFVDNENCQKHRANSIKLTSNTKWIHTLCTNEYLMWIIELLRESCSGLCFRFANNPDLHCQTQRAQSPKPETQSLWAHNLLVRFGFYLGGRKAQEPNVLIDTWLGRTKAVMATGKWMMMLKLS